MTKRLKAPAIDSEEEFRATIAEIAFLQNSVAALCAKRDGIVQRVQARYAERIQPLEDDIDAKLSLVEKYADDHRATLLPKDRKSVETALAVFGWRTGNRTVRPLNKQWTEEKIIAALKAGGFEAYVRTVEEIAKDKILADSKDGMLPSPNGAMAVVALSLFGLKIAQSETFYVEPKAPSGETLKASEAKAS